MRYEHRYILAGGLALLLAGTMARAGEELHEHAQHGHASPEMAALTLHAGERWETDAALRAGMQHIRDAVAARAQGFHAGRLDAAEAAGLANSVRDDVSFLLANCRLAPEADANLHLLIGRLLTGAAALERDPVSAEGMPQLLGVLRDYPRYFAHPDWSPVGEDGGEPPNTRDHSSSTRRSTAGSGLIG